MKAGVWIAAGVAIGVLFAGGAPVGAQAVAAPPPGATGRAAAAGRQVAAPPEAYPPRPPADPAVLARGRALYSVHCAFCHGADARGGDGGGPNLLRSQLVLGDQHGEAIGEVVQNGRPGTNMVAIKLTAEQISDIATFIHSFRVEGYDPVRNPPPSIIVGDARAGQTAFQARCASCHSATGDLKGVSAKFPDPRALQEVWLFPTGGRGRGGDPVIKLQPTTATVTLPSGQTMTGRLIRIDDFLVTIEQPDGLPRSFARSGDAPKVEIHDPLKPHRDLLPKYTDKEIHDITAYLVTLK